MATYTENSDTYASKGVGNAGLALGIIGTSLASGILGGNGVGGIFNGNGNRMACAANDAMTLAMAQKDAEIAQLKADKATDAKLVEVYKDLRALDKAQDAAISDLKDRVSAIETAAPLREQIVLGQVDADGGRIRDPMVREGIRDCVRTLRWIGCMERERTPARASAVSAARQ